MDFFYLTIDERGINNNRNKMIINNNLYNSNKVKDMKNLMISFLAILLFVSCSENGKKADAYGNFEAIETLISSEAAGKLIFFNIEEGKKLLKGDTVAVVDTVSSSLKRKQLQAMKEGVSSKISGVLSQIAIYEKQLETALKDKERFEKMFREGAATQKQMDDIDGRVEVLEKQIKSIETQNAGILAEIKSVSSQIEQLDDLISKSTLINPINGTVLNKYAEQYEMTAPGKPLYNIANTDELILRAYISGDQLPIVKIGAEVKIFIDKSKTENTELQGEILWVSDKAEFTPKIIQTKDERVNLVYAIKIKVKNDGSLKIGMPAEVRF